MTNLSTDLILASTSPYRERLLRRLAIPFYCRAPGTDESPLPGEQPAQLAGRLALAKAGAVARLNAGSWVIGSDQVASLDGDIMQKPGTHENAVAQLVASSGKRVDFYTGVALVGGPDRREWFHVEHFSVYFQELSLAKIEAYLRLEQPYDCAGSFKCEGLGIVLFERLRGDDPTSLEGLPLIALTRLLRQAGIEPLNTNINN
jgi:septum formation protein